jgi:1-aminocyclopropane-1-carboxylate deaminase/D-cysteine desulfhydrase-like pyridoxal-dependent ACC family enzyme
MAKAARGLVGLVERGAIGRGEVVVLLHSGGSHGLFADTPDLRRWVADHP